MKSAIYNLNKEVFEKTVERRRTIHQNPELSFKEFETQAFIRRELEGIGITDIQDKAGTGLVALIKGHQKGCDRVVALRADMDALPIEEENGAVYASQNKGVMHACGHDAHTASLLGTAYILHQLKSQFSGTVKLLFQPGEERLPGGAHLMIKDGALSDPTPQSIIGQHVMPFIDAGKVGFRSGMYMASCDEVFLTIKGKGGHGALPSHCVDPVIISSHILVALQQMASRWTDPKMPTVLSFGKVVANGSTNVIPDEVYIEGTFRAMDEGFRAVMHDRIKNMVVQMAESMGARADVCIRKGYPFLKNDEKVTDVARHAAKDYLGEENVQELDIWMGAEDFSYYSQEIPASFYRLGTRNTARGIVHPVHNAKFDIEEDAFKIGPGLMAYIALQKLEN